MTIAQKVSISFVAAAAAFMMFVANADAATVECVIRGNGSRSRNSCSVTVRTGGRRRRARKPRRRRGGNTTTIRNSVTVSASTGGNSANGNTGGNVDIHTGDAGVVVRINN